MNLGKKIIGEIDESNIYDREKRVVEVDRIFDKFKPEYPELKRLTVYYD